MGNIINTTSREVFGLAKITKATTEVKKKNRWVKPKTIYHGKGLFGFIFKG
jgi:hypothetical protein